MSKVITNYSSDDEIKNTYDEERKRVERWCRKLIINRDNIKKAKFDDGYLIFVLHNGAKEYIGKYKTIGIIPWLSNKSGNTWLSVVFEDIHHGAHAIHVYYWNTIGSIGMIVRTIGNNELTGDVETLYFVFSSHCMLRYRDRFAVGYEGVDLITYMYSRVGYFIPNVEDESVTIICKDGVFKGIESDCVVRLKTFISWSELNVKSRNKYKSIWDKKHV